MNISMLFEGHLINKKHFQTKEGPIDVIQRPFYE